MVSIATIKTHAKKALHKHYKHVAILMRGGAIMAIGYNHGECHAEKKAISQIWPDHRPGLTLLSFRLTTSGKLSMAKPCAECEKLLIENGIHRIQYSDSFGKMIKARI
jgi:deoxycytidylate deaminase